MKGIMARAGGSYGGGGGWGLGVGPPGELDFQLRS
jgi:hypothetical protein